MKKKVITLIIAVIVFLLSACDGRGGETNELIVWGDLINTNYETLLERNPNDAQALYSKVVLEKFYAKYPNVTVKAVNMGWAESLNQQFMNSAKARTLPDVFFGETYTPIYARSGLLKEITISDDVLGDVIDGGLAHYSYDGKVYGVPIFTSPFALYYNKSILIEAGVDEADVIPETWDELVVNCNKVADTFRFSNGKVDIGGIVINNSGGLASPYYAMPWLLQAGANFTDANGNITFNDANAEKAFGFIRDIAKTVPNNSLDLTEDSIYNLFLNEKVAYMIGGSWVFNDMSADELENFGVCKLPVPEKGDTDTNVLVGSMVVSVTRDCKNAQMANDFIAILLDETVQPLVVDAYSRIPSRISVLENNMSSILEKASYLSLFTEIMSDSNIVGGLPAFEKNSTRIWDNWRTAYYEIMTTDTSISSILNELQNDVAGLVD